MPTGTTRRAASLRTLIATSEETRRRPLAPDACWASGPGWSAARATGTCADELLRRGVGRGLRSAPALGEPGPDRPRRDPGHARGHRRRARRARRLLPPAGSSPVDVPDRLVVGGPGAGPHGWGSARGGARGLRPGAEEAAGTVVEEPGILQADAPYMDCAIALGRLDEAAEHLRLVVDDGPRLWTTPPCWSSARDRGAAAGRPRRPRRGGALMIPDMLSAHDDGVGPLQTRSRLPDGRAGLPTGEGQDLGPRRARARGRIYDELGAEPYAEQARAELARVGLRPPGVRRPDATPSVRSRSSPAHRPPQPRDRGPDVPQREDGRGRARPGLPQARDQVPGRAGRALTEGAPEA